MSSHRHVDARHVSSHCSHTSLARFHRTYDHVDSERDTWTTTALRRVCFSVRKRKRIVRVYERAAGRTIANFCKDSGRLFIPLAVLHTHTTICITFHSNATYRTYSFRQSYTRASLERERERERERFARLVSSIYVVRARMRFLLPVSYFLSG